MHFPPRVLSHELLELFILALQLLDTLVMVVHGRAEDFLCPLLADDELVEVFL